MKFIAKKHTDNSRRLFLNIIDPELKNCVLEEKGRIIDLRQEYYCGEEIEEKEIEKLLEKAFTIQFIGNKSVDFGIRKGIVERVSTINKIKYAFVIKI